MPLASPGTLMRGPGRAPARRISQNGFLTGKATQLARAHTPGTALAYATDLLGVLVGTGANVSRPEKLTLTANQVRNPRGVGAAAGVAPTYWSLAGSGGVSATVVGTGTDSAGIPYVEIAVGGTAAGGVGKLTVRWDGWSSGIGLIPAQNGQTWTASAYHRASVITAGSCTHNTVIDEQTASGAWIVSGSSTATALGTGTLTAQRKVLTRTLAGGNTVASIQGYSNFAFADGAVDMVIRVGCPMLEQASNVSTTRVMPADGTTGVSYARTARRLLVEPGRSNALADAAGYASGFDWASVAGALNFITAPEDMTAAGWGKNAVGVGSVPVVTADAGTDPNGGSGADQVVFALNGGSTTGDSSNLIWFRSSTVGAAYTASIWVKTTDASTKRVRFDFNGVSAAYSNSSVAANSPLFDVTGTWQRLSITGFATSTSYYPALRLRGSLGTADSASLLVWGALLEQPALPSPYYTAQNGWVTPNLLQQPEALDLAPWGTARASIVPNATAAPNGTLTADKLVSDTSLAATHYLSQNMTVTAGQSYALSLHVKQGEVPRLRPILPASLFGTSQANLDTRTGGSTSVSGMTVTSTDAGNGWWRFTMVATATSSGTAALQINLINDATGSISFDGDGTSGLYLWGALLEAVPTTASAYASAQNGITAAVVGRGVTAHGFPFVDVNFSGTGTSTSSFAGGVGFQANGATAANLQSWAGSVQALLPDPTSLTGIGSLNLRLELAEFAAGGYVGSQYAPLTQLDGVRRSFQAQRNTQAADGANGATTSVKLNCKFASVSGTAVNATVRFVLPQLEQVGATGTQSVATVAEATSPIWLPSGSTGTAARAADSIVENPLDWLTPSGQRRNLLLGTSSLPTQSVSVTAQPYTLSFYGTGSVALSGAATGSLAGTGASTRVSLTVTPSAGLLTLTVTGSVTSAQLNPGTVAEPYLPVVGTNLFTNSDALNTAYGFFNARWDTIPGNDPFGGTTMRRLVENTATAITHAGYQPVAATAGVTYCQSVYAQAGERQFLQIGWQTTAFPSATNAFFDLVNGTVVSATGGTAGIAYAGNGIWRCWFSATATVTATANFNMRIAITGSNATYDGDGVSGLWLGGCMLESGVTTPSPYVSTTSGVGRPVPTFAGTFGVKGCLPSFPTGTSYFLPLLGLYDAETGDRMVLGFDQTQSGGLGKLWARGYAGTGELLWEVANGTAFVPSVGAPFAVAITLGQGGRGIYVAIRAGNTFDASTTLSDATLPHSNISAIGLGREVSTTPYPLEIEDVWLRPDSGPTAALAMVSAMGLQI